MNKKLLAALLIGFSIMVVGCGNETVETVEVPEVVETEITEEDGKGDVISEEEADTSESEEPIDEESAEETLEYDEEEPTEGAPYVEEGRFIDEEAIADLDIAGEYSGIQYGKCELSMYTDVEEGAVEVGNIVIYDENGNVVIESTVNKIMDNMYELGSEQNATITIYTDNETVCFELYENGEHSDYFVMTSPYIS